MYASILGDLVPRLAIGCGFSVPRSGTARKLYVELYFAWKETISWQGTRGWDEFAVSWVLVREYL